MKRHGERQELGDLRIGRILQNAVVMANHNWNVAGPKCEPVEQGLDTGIAVGIEIRVRLPIANEELTETQGRGGVPRSDEHDLPGATRGKLCAPEDRRGQTALTQLHA